MKKLSIIIILLSCISTFSFSQQKTEFGITAEGSWFMPHRKDVPFSNNADFVNKNGFGSGIGVYASRYLFWKISADVGLGYRYKQMKQFYKVYEDTGSGYTGETQYGYDDSDNVEGWDKLPMHYIVVPVHLQMLLSKNFFVRGGIESTWLMNYSVVNEKPEFNWTIGFGSQKYKLKWSVNYIRGLKKQGFGDRTIKADGHYLGSINRNNMLQFNLSYPIWGR